MNQPYNKKQIKALPIGYTPTQFPNRRMRREILHQSNKGKRQQIIEHVVVSHKYKQGRTLEHLEGMYNGAMATFYKIRKIIHHLK